VQPRAIARSNRSKQEPSKDNPAKDNPEVRIVRVQSTMLDRSS